MMTYVFLGPSAPLAEARQNLDAVYLPPVRQGDVYRLVSLRKPSVIAIIDGYFNQVPAVWHKEILWALDLGVEVFGASSMGALRAVELETFGMQGVGRIFEAYRAGVLPPYLEEVFENDDEVAVRHGPGELGYLSLSEALVNMRFTLAAAAASGVVRDNTRDDLVRLGKSLFYPQRSYERLLAEARAGNLPEREISALESWLPEGRVDQKREDALQLLRAVGQRRAGGTAAQREAFTFQHTVQWQIAVESAATFEVPTSGVLDELRLDAEKYLSVRRVALEQLIAVTAEDSAHDLGAVIRDELEPAVATQDDAILTALHHLPEQVDAHWSRELKLRELDRVVRSLPASIIERHMLRVLRQSGEHATLNDRSRRKRDVLATLKSAATAAELNGLQELQLQDWYFSTRLGQGIPQDLEAYVRNLGFGELAAFNQALLCEYAYLERESKHLPT